MSLTLVSGTPRLGLRARDHVLAPLHGSVPPPKDRPRLPTPEDINADPLSSDEESVAKEKIAALPLESSPLENGQEKNRKPALQTQAQSNDSNSVRKGGTKPGSAPEWALPPDPLDIKSAIFTSNKSTGSGNCSRGSRKSTASEVEDDEDLSGSMDCSQPSKRRRGLKTYIKPQNIHKTESAGVQQKSEKKVVSAKGQGVPTFKNFNTEPLLSRVSTHGNGSEKISFREPSISSGSTQSSRRASHRSSKSTQASSEDNSIIFKRPLRESPRRNPTFRTNAATFEIADAPPTPITRPSAPAKTRPVLADHGPLESFKVLRAVNTVKERLGLSDIQFEPSPSSIVDSSPTSPSFDPATPMSQATSSHEDVPPELDQFTLQIKSADIPISDPSSRSTTCPMCKKPVERSIFEEYTSFGSHMNIRKQAQFCKVHMKRDAEREWEERRYPIIDWQCLDVRIAKYHDTIDEILRRTKFSFYRNVFADSIKDGKSKTLPQSLISGGENEAATHGYYGTRGARVMVDNIMFKFASKIRRLAASDKLISSGGVSGYVQAVLVPELAVLLVMDDMGVDEDKSREILADSGDIGNLLNEEEDEIIRDPEPKEKEVI